MFSTEMQYSVVRYMLNDLGDEAANVGLIAATVAPYRVLSRFLADPSAKSRSDVRVSREVIERFSGRANSILSLDATSPVKQAEALFERLSDIGAGLVRLTPPRSVLTNDADAEFELLFQQWVAPRTQSTQRRPLGPRDPLGGLRREAAGAVVREFRQGYGRPLSRKSFTRYYPVRGASSHSTIFDLALHTRTGRKRHEHLFHHLLVLPDAEDSYSQAAALCWRWQDVCAKNGAERQLTAVVYERPSQLARGVTDATKLLHKEDIEVIGLKQLREVAKEIDGQLSLA